MRFALLCFCSLLILSACAGSPVNYPADLTAITNVQLLSMKDGEPVQAGQTVLIGDGRILRIGADREVSVPKAAGIIRGEGQFLVPGLIDAHVHIWDHPELAAYLANGVTTVRNASGMPFHLQYADAIKKGEMAGPSLLTTGPILNSPGPNAQPNHQLVMTAEEAREAVRQQYAQGYRHLKVYSNLSREAYEAILKEAALLEMSVMGHPPEGLREDGIPFEKPFNIAFDELLDDEFVTLEHMESLVWHALYDELNEDKLRLLAKQIAAAGIAVSPTLVAHRNLTRVADSQGDYLKRSGVETLNPFIAMLEQELYQHWASQAPGTRADFDRFYARATKIFQEEGVTLIAGSDAGIFINIPGLSLHDELALLVAAGLTPRQALATATSNPAQVLGLANTGLIAEGYVADLLLLEKNPLQNIDNLRKPRLVIANGKVYDGAAVARLKQQASQTSLERSQEQLMQALEAQGSSL
jgi:imidazolonepropionase-like amidohydrolase